MTGRGSPASDSLNYVDTLNLELPVRASGSASPILQHDHVEVMGCPSISP